MQWYRAQLLFVNLLCGYKKILTHRVFGQNKHLYAWPMPSLYTNVHLNPLISMENVWGHCDLKSGQNYLNFVPLLEGP